MMLSCPGQEIEALWQEYEDGRSPEALMVKDFDEVPPQVPSLRECLKQPGFIETLRLPCVLSHFVVLQNVKEQHVDTALLSSLRCCTWS